LVDIFIHPSEPIDFQQCTAGYIGLFGPIYGDECLVFLADIQDFDTEELFNTGLSIEEQYKALRYSHPTSAQLYVLGKYLTRKVIAQQLGLAPLSLSFRQTETGKPYLDPEFGNLKFNLSHSGTKVAIAISAEEVGVDIEFIKSIKNIDGIIASCFSKVEALEIQQSEKSVAIFYSQWTIKEAIGKCLGQGIGLDLKILPSLAGRHSLALEQPIIAQLEVFTFSLDQYAVSIATANTTPQLNFYRYY